MEREGGRGDIYLAEGNTRTLSALLSSPLLSPIAMAIAVVCSLRLVNRISSSLRLYRAAQKRLPLGCGEIFYYLGTEALYVRFGQFQIATDAVCY